MNVAGFEIRPFTIEDYEDALALWEISDGMALSSADRREAIETYLARNPGLSLVAVRDRKVIGTLLCGHDGRRGYLHHLAVAFTSRRLGIGRALVATALRKLAEEKIEKCHVLVVEENDEGILFWERIGWQQRTGLKMFSQFVRSD